MSSIWMDLRRPLESLSYLEKCLHTLDDWSDGEIRCRWRDSPSAEALRWSLSLRHPLDSRLHQHAWIFYTGGAYAWSPVPIPRFFGLTAERAWEEAVAHLRKRDAEMRLRGTG